MPSRHSQTERVNFPTDSSMKSKLVFYLQKWTYGETYHDVWIILLIQLNVLIYALSFWMQQPVLPFIIETLGSQSNNNSTDSYSTAFGYFQTMVSFLQLIGGPLLGKYTDKSGAKQALILCQIGSAFSYFFLGSSTSLTLLFISRVTTILQQVMQTAQASVAQLTDDKHREQSMGRLYMAYGIGMILGSSTGGIITKYSSIQTNAFCAAFISLLIVVLDLIFLPSLKTTHDHDQKENKSPDGLFGHFGDILSLMMRPCVRGLCLFLFFAGFGITLYRSMFSMIFKEVFKFEGYQLGFYISYAALISTLSNSFFVGWARSKYSDDNIVQSCVVTLSLCLGVFGYGCTHQIIGIEGLCVLTIPQTIASGVVHVMMSGAISKMVDKTEMGTAIALTHALRSGTGVIAPTIGGHLVAYGGYQSVGYFGLCSGLVSVVLFKSLVSSSKYTRQKQNGQS
eukprot:224513_1